MGERTVIANKMHEKFRLESIELLKKWSGELPADEMLAIAAQLLGQIIAMQDQRKHTNQTVMAIVTKNLEDGNRNMVDQVMNGKGHG